MSELMPPEAQPIDDQRDEYEAPELRDLGGLVDLTEAAGAVGANDGSSYS